MGDVKAKRNRLINLKVNADEALEMQRLADQYEGGNLSRWIRTRAMSIEGCNDLYVEIDLHNEAYVEAEQ